MLLVEVMFWPTFFTDVLGKFP